MTYDPVRSASAGRPEADMHGADGKMWEQSEGARLTARVRALEALGSMFRLTLDVPGWRTAGAGQFAVLQAPGAQCFLGRPFSVCEEAGEAVSFLIAPVGTGTKELCSLATDAVVWVLGPLGEGFDVDALVRSPGRAVLVGGGVGVAPFPLLLARMAEAYRELTGGAVPPAAERPLTQRPEVLVLLGFRDSGQAGGAAPVQEAALSLGESGLRCRLEIAVEDGSRGPGEKVTALLQRHLEPGDRVAVCGPEAMSREVWRVCAAVPDVRAWFSLEAGMACGVGSCHGCVIRLADGTSARVCREGPVFRGDVVFDG